jgi:hypothetical protein
VKFWIEDPWGATVYDPGLVCDRYAFQVICAREGDSTLYFDNSFSSTVGKDIYIRYRVWSI